MSQPANPCHVVEIPVQRRVVLNFLDFSAGKHAMVALLEVDVTVARQLMAAHKARTGERLSFTGYLTYCLAQAVEQDKSVQAYRKGRKQMAHFDDVDVGMMIERQRGGVRAPAGYVVRRANHKSFLEIHREIRAVQALPAAAGGKMPPWLGLMLAMPGPFLKLVHAAFRFAKRRDPARVWVAMAGTVAVTAVGMFGSGGGWGLAPDGHSLCLIVGGIARKPAVVQDHIEPREILNLTVVFDHDVVDGGPAARFITRLVELIESSSGLEEIDSLSPERAGPAAVAA